MSKGRWILPTTLGIVLVCAAVGEHRYRQMIEQRYRSAVEGRRQLELQFGEYLAGHEQLTGDLAVERQRSQELSATLNEKSAQLERALARLAEEGRSAQQLQLRLSRMEQQMNQLQGELALTLQQPSRQQAAEGPPAVQLERVLVSDTTGSGLQGRVVSVHQDWEFIIIDLGWDAVKIGDTVSIFRNEELLAKARIDRVQEGVSAATILPGWEASKISVNDRVGVL